MFKAVFLDRDGVLNHTEVRDGKPYAPTNIEDFKILPGTFESLSMLKKLGFVLAVITNQPDVGNGKIKKVIVEKMNAMLLLKLPIDVIKVCYHAQTDGCDCRKPKPGMILEAAADLQASLSQSYMIGDRSGDISAGKAAGCTTILIDRNYAEDIIEEPDFKELSLESAINIIISQNMDK